MELATNLPAFDRQALEQLHGTYHQLFEVKPAFSANELAEVFKLRYQVLCEERRMLDPSAYPDGQERDQFDDHATQLMLWHRPSNQLVGCMRLIFAERNTELLPSCIVYPAFTAVCPMPRTVEFSRLVISQQMRRRQQDHVYGSVSMAEAGENASRRLIPHAAIGLFRAALEQIQGRDVAYGVALIEPALNQLIRKMGLKFAPAGEAVDCYGLRVPVYARFQSLLHRLSQSNPVLWAYLTDQGRLTA